jgi:hypothetical protein
MTTAQKVLAMKLKYSFLLLALGLSMPSALPTYHSAQDEQTVGEFETLPTSYDDIVALLNKYLALQDQLKKIRNIIILDHATFTRQETLELTNKLFQIATELQDLLPTIKTVNLLEHISEIKDFLTKSKTPLREINLMLWNMMLEVLDETNYRIHQVKKDRNAWRHNRPYWLNRLVN